MSEVNLGRETTPGRNAPAYVLADFPVAVAGQQLSQLRGYAIADASARFLRAQGHDVLFSLGFDSFTGPVEAESARMGLTPREWTDRCYEQTRVRLEELGCSCDWERAFMSSQPECYRWSQWLFLKLLEQGVIQRRGERWTMRLAPDADELDSLPGWDEAATAQQRETLGLVEGVEIQASTFGAGELVVFTPHVDAIAEATFVAISPAHPDVARWTTDAEIAQAVAAIDEHQSQEDEQAPETAPMVLTEQMAIVPGVAGMLPMVVTPLVDRRFGATAVLGIPERDPLDRAFAARLPAPAGAAWKTSSGQAATRPAARLRARDVAVSRPQAWGTPVPIVDCPSCGLVPVGLDELPVPLVDESPANGGAGPGEHDPRGRTCPSCGGPAALERSTIDPLLDRMWMWMAICVPPEDRSSAMADHPEFARWLPVHQAICDVHASADAFARRTLAQMLQDVGELPQLERREPFARVLAYGGAAAADNAAEDAAVDPGDRPELDLLLAHASGDAVRLALLYTASRGRALRWNDGQLRCCERFLARLRDYAEPRLSQEAAAGESFGQPRIDTSDPLRRRLACWCATACQRITANLDDLQPQPAVHDCIRLLARIEDFESRALERRGELDAHDHQAIAAALSTLARLLAPLAPHVAQELWSAAGNSAEVTAGGWPAPTGA